MEINDLAGLGKGLEKLVEMVSKGAGVVYKPRAIRKEAEAEAYRIRLLARAEAEADAEKRAVLAVPADSPILAAEVPLLQRAATRVAHQEAEKQSNIETVVEHAANNMTGDVSDAPVDKTWTNRFFASASEVSDEAMQEVWGKVLAGEVKQPGSFSLRSMDVLRNLSKKEAESFRKLCYLRMGSAVLKTSDSIRLEAYGVTYAELLGLRAAGLVHDGDSLSIGWEVPCVRGYQGQYLLMQSADVSAAGDVVDKSGERKFKAVMLTTVGLELSSLIEPSPHWDYVRALAQHLVGTLGVKLWRVDVAFPPDDPDSILVVDQHELPDS